MSPLLGFTLRLGRFRVAADLEAWRVPVKDGDPAPDPDRQLAGSTGVVLPAEPVADPPAIFLGFGPPAR